MMSLTRRQIGLRLIGAAGASLLVQIGGRAPAYALDADDDDAPPNVFISPSGQPFRARITAPYPVVDWFKQADKNGDGRIDHAEFLADAQAFFNTLDLAHKGVLTPYDVELYERRVAPEVLGQRVEVGRRAAPRLWLAQMGGGMGAGGGAGPIDPGGGGGGGDSDQRPKAEVDETNQGASPYSFFNEPEPVTTADLDFTDQIKLSNFLKLADDHFTTLDPTGRGYLTLATLPKTAMQKQVEHWQKRHPQK